MTLRSGSYAPKTDAANATAHAPEKAVNRPDAANKAGTSGVPRRSRMIHVLNRNHAPAASADS